MPANRILEKMLDRLYASLMRGPSLNCRPHSSRQRIDLTELASFDDMDPAQILPQLLNGDGQVKLTANVKIPQQLASQPFVERQKDEQFSRDPAVVAWRAQKALLTKLRNLSEDARTYEQDTGVHALELGYPILSLPPGSFGGTRRILAPIAFVPIAMEVSSGRKPGIELRCRGEGVDLVTPNHALVAWLERETGKPAMVEVGEDEGERRWEEISELIARTAHLLEMENIDAAALADAEQFTLDAVPRSEELRGEAAVLRSAVLGLFPMSNQGLLHDTKAMIEAERIDGPVAPFVDVNAVLDVQEHDVPDLETSTLKMSRRFDEERLVALADPCQARTVELARSERGLVVHGPPGTGKSQTITNIIGDHLARGQRVLFVCDKRTALDVVANRLEHLGLGYLCAVVHDPQRDQRDLYMSIRARLEALSEVQTHPRAGSRVEKIDAELRNLHDELEGSRRALMESDGQDASFHELMGQWLALVTTGATMIEDAALAGTRLQTLEDQRGELELILDRAASIGFPHHPWQAAAGVTLDAYLRRSMPELRRAFASCMEHARVTDATVDERIPPFDGEQALDVQAAIRADLRDRLAWIGGHVDDAVRQRVASLNEQRIEKSIRMLDDARAYRKLVGEGALDATLMLAVRDAPPAIAQLNTDIADLQRYIESAASFFGFLAFGAKNAADAVVRKFGLPRTVEDARKLKAFLEGLRARLVLTHILAQLAGEDQAGGSGDGAKAGPEAGPGAGPGAGLNRPLADDGLLAQSEAYEKTLAAAELAAHDANLDQRFREALVDAEKRATLLQGLQRSGPRAEALMTLENAMREIDLFDGVWLRQFNTQGRAGKKAGETLARLDQRLDELEAVLRVRDGLNKLPAAFRGATEQLVDEFLDQEAGMAALRRAVLAGEIKRQLDDSPQLRQLDGKRIEHAFARFAELEDEKRRLVGDAIIHQWVSKQKERLLVGTGSRLNGDGADLRRRLFVRGKRAMRLRQMLAVGRKIEGGDPLFDMCPVWMASPETVAQIFPRKAMFDIVIFDEASQCRLEEALPVLLRAERVVIAGDPKQLPPTRFFEAAISTSDDEELETDQDLFEAQQGEVEDLLAAALNLQVNESYLDVHYRSRNADLIEFSNQQFYRDRLQAIPGHPSNRTRFAPITLHRAHGLYDERCNTDEARHVVVLVDELLKRSDPPSIGIASFNLKQRDLIVDLLEERALEDDAFARRLARARQRKGEGSFEGLFVKNLENVQGDERDHIIISTTYGPNKQGKFYRRFGPLGRAGGGRRLNVLVTRARHEVHLVTSIPREVYQHVDNIPEGMSPNGGWLLMAYLRYAEELAEMYEENHRVLEQAEVGEKSRVIERPIQPFSHFARALATTLAREHGISSDVHWGNQGFCIDLALHHPQRAEDVTLGVLCDFNRFPHASDPLEWEIFRTGILQWQGWQLHRVWTPQFFRDPEATVNHLTRAAQTVAADLTLEP